MPRTRTKPDIFETASKALADAQEEQRHRAVNLRQAETDAERLRDRLRRGDDSVSPADLTAYDAAIQHAGYLLEAADLKLRKAIRALPVRPTLAEALRPALEALLAGVPVVVLGPGEAVPTVPDQVPSAYLTQRKANDADMNRGTLSGKAELTYVRGALHAVPDPSVLSERLAQLGHRLDARHADTRSLDGGMFADVFALDVRMAWPERPIISTEFIKGERSSNLQAVSSALAGEMTWSATIDRLARANARALVDIRASAELVDVTVTGTERVLLVDLAFSVRNSKHGSMSVADKTRLVTNAVGTWPGRCSGGVGRVASASVVGVEPSGSGAVRYVVRVAYSSALPA